MASFLRFSWKGSGDMKKLSGRETGMGSGKVHGAVFELGTLEAQLQHAHGAIVADSNSYKLVRYHKIPTDWLGLVVWLGVDLLLFFFYK